MLDRRSFLFNTAGIAAALAADDGAQRVAGARAARTRLCQTKGIRFDGIDKPAGRR